MAKNNRVNKFSHKSWDGSYNLGGKYLLMFIIWVEKIDNYISDNNIV